MLNLQGWYAYVVSCNHCDLLDDEDMIEEIEIRESLPSDVASIDKLYPDAFPDEDLLPLVRELLREEPIVLSLVGIVDRALVGHVIFTTCSIIGSTDKVSLLGPLAVAPAWQRQGIGSALVREGLLRLENASALQVYVLGDPAYYERVGFEPEAGVTPPYPLPEEWRGAWQSISLHNAKQPPQGKLSVPQSWLQPALWAP
jgi:putative acetyltransferase